MTNEKYLLIVCFIAVFEVYKSTPGIQKGEWPKKSNDEKSFSAVVEFRRDDKVKMNERLYQKENDLQSSVTNWEVHHRASDTNRSRHFLIQDWPTATSVSDCQTYFPEDKPAGILNKIRQANSKREGELDFSNKSILSKVMDEKKVVNGLESIKKKLSPKKPNTVNSKIGSTLTEYPGKNNTIRTELFEHWNTYYKCLQNHTSFMPRAHYAFPGNTIRLICEACLQPGDDTEIQWSMATVKTSDIQETINTSQQKSTFSRNNRFVVSLGGLLLSIHGVSEKDAGNYSCTLSQTLMTVHLLQVAENTEKINKVWPTSSPRKPQAAPEIILPGIGLVVFTKWQNWTSCSRCGHVGKSFRIGVCTVRTINVVNTHAPTALTTFKEGVPCRSQLLPKDIQNHPNVASRMSEVMEAFCKNPCPKVGTYVVRNRKGEIVEDADNAKGIYSMFQKLPRLPPPVKRKIMFLNQWDTAYLQCPGGILSDVPVLWFIGKQPIYSKGDRIFVTPAHILVIEDLGLSDSRLYSCWQGSRLVGTIRLQVSQPIRLSISQQISSISMILIVLTFVAIFSRVFCNAIQQKA